MVKALDDRQYSDRVVWRDDWSAEAVGRFWDNYVEDPRNQEIYFAKQLGRGIASMLKTALPEGQVLDFGCGPGYLAEHLTAAGFVVRGVDLSEQSVRLANERNQRHPNWGGATSDAKSFEPGSFDAITCVETLEHLEDEALQTSLSHIRRLLKPGAVALFTTPHDEDLSASPAYCPFCDSSFHSVQHVRTWTAESLRSVLAESGFDVLRCAPTDLERWIPLHLLPWMGIRRAAARIWDRRAKTSTRFSGGPHLIAIVKVGVAPT